MRILSCMFIFSILFTSTAFAADVEKPVVNLDPEKIVYSNEIVTINSSPDFLGTTADETGYFLPDKVMSPAAAEALRGTYTSLFSVTATAVYEMLTSKGANKYFYESSLTNGGLCIYGRLYNTYSGYPWARAGACIYNSSSGTFISAGSDYFPSGEYYSTFFSTSIFFEPGTQYFAFIQNPASNVEGSYVHGSLTYYNATDALPL